jgi:hypothetical protein
MFIGLVRTSISTGPEDIHRYLPSWRWFRLGRQLQEKAEADGKQMTREEADYIIDKALTTGLLDSDGCLIFRVRGTREEIVAAIMETTDLMGQAYEPCWRPAKSRQGHQGDNTAMGAAGILAVMLASLAYIIASALG